MEPWFRKYGLPLFSIDVKRNNYNADMAEVESKGWEPGL
jgi:hypothetical protein